jgi:hypothetical protein
LTRIGGDSIILRGGIMASKLHDSDIRSSILARVRALQPNARGRWGKMSVDQMLWHVNQSLAHSVGEGDIADVKPPLPRKFIKFLVLNLPWTKNAPTNSRFVAKGAHDFDAEKARCLRLIDVLANRTIDGVWMDHPVFGPMIGEEVSRLQAKHLDHHLKQFGA